MKKSGLAVILSLFIALSIQGSEPRVVKVGAFNFYPGIFRDNDGYIKGFYVDSLKEIEERENIRFEYIWGTWTDGLDRIRTGEVDILTSVAYTRERDLYLDYCTTPLLTVWSELYVPLKSGIDDITGLQGKKIALMKGDINALHFIDLAEKFHITFQQADYPSFDEVFRAVARGDADAGVVNCTFGAAKQREYGMRSTGVIFNPFDIYFAAADGKNHDLLELLGRYLLKWKHGESSVFNTSRQNWSHGNVGTIEIIPDWVIYSAIVLGLTALLFLLFAILLRSKVRKATEGILKREELLKLNKAKLRSYIDNSPEGIFVADEKGKFLEVNPAASVVTGYSGDDLLKISVHKLLSPDAAEKDIKIFHELKNKGRISTESEFLHRDGTKRWCSVEGTKLSETRFLGFVKDITGRKSAEERIQNLLNEKELLLKEVHHRIKNNMNTIKGLISLQKSAMYDENYSALLEDVEFRVQSMITLYDKLYCSQNYRELPVKDYIQKLAGDIIYNFPNRDMVKLETDISDFILNVAYLTPVGIIVNELLTNIMKHAFTGRASGVIMLSLSQEDSSIVLIVEDNGCGLRRESNHGENQGFGLNLVAMLINQIGGTMETESNDGTKFTVRFSI